MSKSISSTILDELSRQLEELPRGRKSRLVLGVSGGPDSMSLLYACSRLEVDVVVVHCNYQLRGRDSDKDQRLVEETASMWGCDVVSLKLDPADSEGENLQGWARQQRYRIFRDLRREEKADAISTAHHQDDQLETIIQKILRGAGLTAWKGMDIVSGELFRPFLNLSKAQLLQFASLNHIPYRLDVSNEESTFARNFLRNGWFPVLDELFPGWRENLLRIPDRAREHGAVVRSLLESLTDDEGGLLREPFLLLPPDVRKPLVLEIVKAEDPSAPVSTGTLENLDHLQTLETGQKVQLTEEWSMVRDRERFRLSRTRPSEAEPKQIGRERLQAGALQTRGWNFREKSWSGKVDRKLLQMDADRIDWPLTRRRWKAGDRFNPFGMSGHQTVSDHLTNRKVPADRKREADVLVSARGSVVAVLFPPEDPGERPGTIADWVRCEDRTERVLIVRPVPDDRETDEP